MKSKRRNGLIIFILIIFTVTFSVSNYVYAEKFLISDMKSGDINLKPNTNEGKKWRIGYCESEPYFNYSATFHSIVIGLEELGWISVNEDMSYKVSNENSNGVIWKKLTTKDEMPYMEEDSHNIWEWLTSQDVGPYIEFVEDAYYSLGEHNKEEEEKIIKRLKEEKDIDLMIIMGTYAGKVLANDKHSIPTMVFSSSNAVRSGIIISDTDSGLDHIWAHMDLDRYRRQIEVFHDIFKFKKLGLVYEDSPNGRIYAALSDLDDLSEKLGFQIISYTVDEAREDSDNERYHKEVLEAYQKLAGEVDAMYLTAGTRDINKLSQLLEPFYQKGIPVFSQMGSMEVKYGALLSLYRASYMGIGRFGANNIADVLKGKKPRELVQNYGDTPSIVLNMKVANKIGYKPPFQILLSADEIFQEIEGDK